jgi:hypothetical protein
MLQQQIPSTPVAATQHSAFSQAHTPQWQLGNTPVPQMGQLLQQVPAYGGNASLPITPFAPHYAQPPKDKKAAKFDPGKMLWRDYFAQFIAMAHSNRWDDATRLEKLVEALRGDAVGIYSDNRPQQFYQLVMLLEERFAPRGMEMAFHYQFSSRNLKDTETPQAYAGDLARLARLAYPEADKAQLDKYVVMQFLRGIKHNKDMHKQVCLNDTMSLSAVINRTQQYRSYLQSIGEATPVSEQVKASGCANPTIHIPCRISDGNAQGGRPRNASFGSQGHNNSQQNGRSSSGCEYCGKPGKHRWQDCFTRQRFQPDWAPGMNNIYKQQQQHVPNNNFQLNGRGNNYQGNNYQGNNFQGNNYQGQNNFQGNQFANNGGNQNNNQGNGQQNQGNGNNGNNGQGNNNRGRGRGGNNRRGRGRGGGQIQNGGVNAAPAQPAAAAAPAAPAPAPAQAAAPAPAQAQSGAAPDVVQGN